MKHTYTVTGMTCNGCRTSVEESLNSVKDVISAKVDLEKEEALVEMTKHIPIEVLQKAISGKYKISEKTEKNIFQSSAENLNEKTDL